jgi:hypothetical protein
VVHCNACAPGAQTKAPATPAVTEELTRCGRGYRHHDARCCYSLRGHWVVVAGRASGAAVRQQATDSTLRTSVSITPRMSLRERTRPGLGIIGPCLPSPAKVPPSGPGWISRNQTRRLPDSGPTRRRWRPAHNASWQRFHGALSARCLRCRGPASTVMLDRRGSDCLRREWACRL